MYRFFATGGNGGESPHPSTSQKIAHSPHLEKFPHRRRLLPLPPNKFLSSTTTKQPFSSYNAKNTELLPVVTALAPFLF